jgi:hypothetical protein
MQIGLDSENNIIGVHFLFTWPFLFTLYRPPHLSFSVSTVLSGSLTETMNHNFTLQTIVNNRRINISNYYSFNGRISGVSHENLQVSPCCPFLPLWQSILLKWTHVSPQHTWAHYCVWTNWKLFFHSEHKDVSFQWNNAQDTVHPLVIHFKNADNTLSNTLCETFTLSSQDAVSVHLYQKHLIQLIMGKVKIKSNQIISVTSLNNLLLSIRIEKFSSVSVAMRRRMVSCTCELTTTNVRLSVTPPVYARY